MERLPDEAVAEASEKKEGAYEIEIKQRVCAIACDKQACLFQWDAGVLVRCVAHDMSMQRYEAGRAGVALEYHCEGLSSFSELAAQ